MRKTSVIIFVFFLILSIVLILTRSGVASISTQSFLQSVFSYPRDYVASYFPNEYDMSEFERLKNENKALLSEKYDVEKLRQENKTLRNQLRDSGDDGDHLVHARIIGRIGDYSSPRILIVDGGSVVGVGDAVVLGDSFVGVVESVSGGYARVSTVYNDYFEVVAQTSETGSAGVVQGGDGVITFDEVVVGDALSRGDLVVTQGVAEGNESFVPAELVVGRIHSLKHDPQAAFQEAEIESLVDFRSATSVFIWKL